MANHLTPTELARESGLERRDVIAKCSSWASRSSTAGSTRPSSSQASVRIRDLVEPQSSGERVAAAPPKRLQLISLPSTASGPARDYSSADWRSSVDVVCSRIFRQARVFSRSASKCLTTLRTRVAEMSIP